MRRERPAPLSLVGDVVPQKPHTVSETPKGSGICARRPPLSAVYPDARPHRSSNPAPPARPPPVQVGDDLLGRVPLPAHLTPYRSDRSAADRALQAGFIDEPGCMNCYVYRSEYSCAN